MAIRQQDKSPDGQKKHCHGRRRDCPKARWTAPQRDLSFFRLHSGGRGFGWLPRWDRFPVLSCETGTSRLKDRYVASLGYGDDQGTGRGLVLEVFFQTLTEQTGLRSDNAIIRGAVLRRPVKYVNADLLLIDLRNLPVNG